MVIEVQDVNEGDSKNREKSVDMTFEKSETGYFIHRLKGAPRLKTSTFLLRVSSKKGFATVSWSWVN